MNKTLYNLVKNRDIIFIIGPMGSGKTIMADQINTADCESGGKGYEIIEDMRMNSYNKDKCRNEINYYIKQNKPLIITVIGNLDNRYDFNNNESIAWIFVGINGYQANNYKKFIHRAVIYKLSKKYFSSIRNHRKTRPYLLVQNDQLRDNIHFGRFKQSNRLL